MSGEGPVLRAGHRPRRGRCGEVEADPAGQRPEAIPVAREALEAFERKGASALAAKARTALARLEGQIALDEILKRFPEWEIDVDNARLTSASVVRGWETLPAFVS